MPPRNVPPAAAPWPDPGELTSAVGRAVNAAWLADESDCVAENLAAAAWPPGEAEEAAALAADLVRAVRRRARRGGMEAFLREYDLGTREGVILMCLAEALLRIPDAATADRLVADKLSAGDWARHLGSTDSLFVNASTWGFMLTGELLGQDLPGAAEPPNLVAQLVARLGEPIVRNALRQAMRILGHQFVMGRTIGEALARAAEAPAYRHSFDMLGEAALTATDADRYLEAYGRAIDAIGEASGADAAGRPEISVKLSALHPRCEVTQRRRLLAELGPRLVTLAVRARDRGVGLTVDAEESERLELTLELVARLRRDPALRGWDGLGLAVQAYQKRALAVLRWLDALAGEGGGPLNVRLVKGAYWDSEVKRAQERGLPGYPVYTRKANTDVAYLACARWLVVEARALRPQFATHNAHTVAAVLTMARRHARAVEFQRLHGMGEDLYDGLVAADPPAAACRVYAPVGSHADLLPYLVRRLLENGANTSFVNRLSDERIPPAELAADPVARVRRHTTAAHPAIPLPRDLYGAERANARGVNLADGAALGALLEGCALSVEAPWRAVPLVAGAPVAGTAQPVRNPARPAEAVGTVVAAGPGDVGRALAAATDAWPAWDAAGGPARAAVLRRAADALEDDLPAFVALCVREAGKTLPDAVSEVREAVDYLRYYAAGAEREFGAPALLPGPAGERNELRLRARGTFACISPWNFPLAIFTGQVAAALAAGNAVLAKPAEQSPLVAARAVACLHAAGVPPDVLHFLPGDGPALGAALVRDERLAGIAFTGSTATARAIARGLAAREGAIPVLIAETGGVNAMLVDSSALPEQVVADAIASAFDSAGQRCSALRVLFLQEEVADRIERQLAGAMDELVLGDPALPETDIGPVIDAESRDRLESHVAAIVRHARWHHRARPPARADGGWFVPPLAVEVDGLARVPGEVFGPILHVVRYAARDLDAVLDAVNATGYGLTLGVQSRIDATARHVADRVRVGNVYVNRTMIGAVVGVQPFGGCGLSGTGPKAGGPHYLRRFATEQTVTVNTAAVGGNASLLSLGGD